MTESLYEVEQDLRRFESAKVPAIQFSAPVEARYRRETGSARARTLFTQGMIALLAYDFFIVGDYILSPRQIARAAIIRFGIVTPLVLLVALLVRNSNRAFVLETAASVLCVVGSLSIIFMHRGGMTAVSTDGQIGLILVLLVANCMLRIEQPYATVTSILILLLDAVALYLDHQIALPQKMFHGGILVWVAILTLTANFSLSQERRHSYLLQLRGALQHRMLREANTALTALSTTDRLTGLPNRRSYDERLEEMWQSSIQLDEPLSAIMIDVDNFKRLNDTHGHQYGDRVLQRVASLLQQALRGEGDFVARFGGEEFVVLLPNADSIAATKVAERIRVLVQVAGSPAVSRDTPPSAAGSWSTVSCGVATTLPGLITDAAQLIAGADSALYRAKQEGRNRVCCAEQVPA